MSLAKVLFATKMEELRTEALGNSHRGIKEIACDLLHDDIGQNKKRRQFVANSCFLNIHTIERLMDCEPNYRPQCDTCERVIRFYSYKLTASEVVIKAKYQNQPKVNKADLIHDEYEM